MARPGSPTLLFTHEQHVVRCRGGYYNPAGMIGYEALRNYLHTIPRAVVVLRCRQAEQIEAGWLRVDGEGIDVHPLPEFGSLGTMVRGLPRLLKALWTAVDRADRYVVRLPGPTGFLVAVFVLLRGHRYGVEMAGAYDEDLQQLLVERRLGPGWLGPVIDRLVGFVVRRAVTVGYRSHYLRRRYPTFRRDREWVFSGAQLTEEVISRPRPASSFTRRPFRIASIGRIAIGKGYPLLVQAFDRLRRRVSVPLEMEIIGDGDEMEKVRSEVARLGLTEEVALPGRVPWGEELFGRLDRAHLFVLPSVSDGMPRSLIEAMARGMPVVSTRVGGIPELVDSQYLVPPDDAEALIERIAPLIGSAAELAEMSRRSFDRSREHWPDVLDRAKRGFWRCVLRWAR
jgi:phosphatidylinositol alpha-1,6-mannosyltransferase